MDSCVLRCVSGRCYEAVYGGDALERGGREARAFSSRSPPQPGNEAPPRARESRAQKTYSDGICHATCVPCAMESYVSSQSAIPPRARAAPRGRATRRRPALPPQQLAKPRSPFCLAPHSSPFGPPPPRRRRRSPRPCCGNAKSTVRGEHRREGFPHDRDEHVDGACGVKRVERVLLPRVGSSLRFYVGCIAATLPHALLLGDVGLIRRAARCTTAARRPPG